MTESSTTPPDETPALTLVTNVGVGLLNIAHIARTLGHVSPASTLDYMNYPDVSVEGAIVRDFVDWTSGRNQFPGARDRLFALLDDLRWADVANACIESVLA